MSVVKYLGLAAALVLAGTGVVVGSPSAVCSSPVAPHIVALGEPHLCEYELHGDSEAFACQTYQGGADRFVGVFRGGRSPQAMFAATGGASQAAMWVRGEDPGAFDCAAAPPTGVPADADYLGTGVCYSHDGQVTPCRMFRHAAARDYEIRRYLVHYEPDGGGLARIESLPEGVNHDALAAEMAWQLGVSLLHTKCCRERGQAYIDYARQLFPDEAAYDAQQIGVARSSKEFAAESGY